MNTKSIKANLASAVPTKTLPPALAKSEATKARCYDKDWKYVKKDSTDLAATFKRIKRELKEQEAALHKAAENVCDLKRKAAK